MSTRKTAIRAAATALALSGLFSATVGTAHATDDSGGARTRIVGGHAATVPTPWMVWMDFDAPQDHLYGKPFCAATLVSPRIALGAAHCASEKITGIPVSHRKIKARVGSQDRTRGGETAAVARVVFGHDWRDGAGDPMGDAAVYVLDHPVEAQTIQMASTSPDVGDEVVLFGWGKTDPNPKRQRQLPKNLQQLETTVVAPQRCTDGTSGELCLDNPDGYAGPGPGDSGGPAVQYIDGVPKLVGICSRGTGSPGTTANSYTEVASGQVRQLVHDEAMKDYALAA
ncbi:S1 family peptidase [Amycolatopsis sp. NPDC059021]|uniref:S1 family peptidase n=1 Tax=Amycolatopsis sp. NPDC059021 TaxID=3346704 RepID=UPI00366AEF1C